MMPIYDYRAISDVNCEFCRNKFETRQGINDEPLSKCLKCGVEVRRMLSRPLLYTVKNHSVRKKTSISIAKRRATNQSPTKALPRTKLGSERGETC
ncbi:MAG: zinc ribbon domain-containing protein [Dehalococcoidia bacterium]|nr:zinc ribbon domain-containing protein [Dehalococcoidia bacterium]